VRKRRFANQEMRRADALRVQNVQDDVGERRQWAVVKSQHNLMVIERKRLIVLHASDAAELLWIDRENTIRADSIGITGTLCPNHHVDRDGEKYGDDREIDSSTRQKITKLMSHSPATFSRPWGFLTPKTLPHHVRK
jgi:hypothetical protein